MSGLIDRAEPTDKTAINYLKNEKGFTDINISAWYARILFEMGYISDKHNFVCPTAGCNAPITCHAIEKKSKTVHHHHLEIIVEVRICISVLVTKTRFH